MLGTHNKVRKREITAIQRVGPDCDTLGDFYLLRDGGVR